MSPSFLLPTPGRPQRSQTRASLETLFLFSPSCLGQHPQPRVPWVPGILKTRCCVDTRFRWPSLGIPDHSIWAERVLFYEEQFSQNK